MGFKNSFKRAAAIGEIALTLGSVGQAGIADLKPDLVKQYQDYSAKVRLPETDQEIARQLRSGGGAKAVPTAGLDRRPPKRLGKRK